MSVAAPVAGDVRTATRTVAQADFDRFADLSGDDNPIHVDARYAARAPFRVPVAHGMFLYGLVHAELVGWLPGLQPVAQQLTFPAPTPVGVTVNGWLKVMGTDAGATRVATTVMRSDGETVLTGEATLVRGSRDIDLVSEIPAPQRSAAGPVPADGSWWTSALGREATTDRRFSSDDLAAYLALVGGPPPAGSVPEPLVASLFSRLLGVDLPGPGTNYLKQSLTFHRAARADDQLAASVRIVRLRPDKRLVDLETCCVDGAGQLVCAGRALVLARGVGPP